MAENESVIENPEASEAPLEDGSTPLEAALAQQIEALVTERDRLIAGHEKVQEKLTEQEQKYLRLMADFDNFRRRSASIKEDSEASARAGVVREILPGLDNFDRARSHVQLETEREEKLHNSYQQVYRQFQGILEKLGVQAIDVVGKPFDPALHEAVLRDESTEVSEETVVAELQKGYILGDRVLRPAMVKVAIPSAAGDSTAQSS
jgi:molecular chaperone GrpE